MGNFHEIDLKVVGGRIRNARKALNLTQEKAAELSFITGQFWSLLESGRERASINTYLQIATVLGLTLDDLFYDDAVALRLHKSFSCEGLLADCSDYEKAILSESLLALKTILKRNNS
jgi:Predicted transcriptional regulators